MSYRTKAKIFTYSGVGLDVLAPFIATLTQFPVWIDRSSDATVSGLFVVMACLCVIPFLKQIKEYLKNPSAPVMWLIVFCVFVVLRNICDEMIIVSLVGLIANIGGSFLVAKGKKYQHKAEIIEDEETKAEGQKG